MKRLIVLVILVVLALGTVAVFLPTTPAAGVPCRLCKPRTCGPCEVYTGDTCLSCGTCQRIHGCHP